MKKFLTTAILLSMFTTCTTMMAQTNQEEYLGLPGDNLNLYAVMKLFQESQTLEGFERNLNDENTRINNLDLNGDNFIDYIKVVDYVDRDVHNIVLQVAVNPRENQDVAVFTVQRFSNGQVQIQLIGDEDLYGRNYIIEPINEQYAGGTPNPGYTGNSAVVRTTYYEVAAWPVIRFMYMPDYIVWNSTWHWGFYPSYWHAWHPFYWHYYYGYHYNWYNTYYSNYHRSDHHRYDHWNDYYYSNRRSHSTYVSHNIQSGHYRNTYSQPDQRRKGEELYARTNTENNNRRQDSFSNHNTAGSDNHSTARRSNSSTTARSDSHNNQSRSSEGNSFSTSRRNYTTATKSANDAIMDRNTGSAKRSSATTRNRTEANTGTTRSSNAADNARPAAGTKHANNSFSDRKSAKPSGYSTGGNNKPAAATAKSRSTGKTSSSGESFSSRRSSGQNQSAKSSKSSETKKSAESDKTARRK